MALLFDTKTVVVTGASQGFGGLLATHFASLGASVVVHDSHDKVFVDATVLAIQNSGGRARGDYSSVNESPNIIETALKAFGSVDILINNARASRDAAWSETGSGEWRSLLEEDFKLAYKCVHAAWPHFKKQKSGRILTTSCLEGCIGRDSPLQSTARYGQLGFVQTLAREGAKYDILACSISTIDGAANPLHANSAAQAQLVRLMTALSLSGSRRESGHAYFIDAQCCRKARWQRASGAYLNPKHDLTAGSILARWDEVNSFSEPEYPLGSADFPSILAKTSLLPPNPRGIDTIRMDGKVILVTGAGSGLGRAYALHFGKLGGHVVLNDLKDPTPVAAEISANGGHAAVVLGSVTDGERIVRQTLGNFGRLDVLINNAGFVRDKSMANMTDELWDSIMHVHVNGTYQMTKAAWPQFERQKYGRIVNITSTSGIYGNFGQSNYSTAKCAIIGFTQALAREGVANNILVNAVAPVASTPALALAVKGSSADILPEYSAPMLALLCSDALTEYNTGCLYEIGAGWHTRTRQQLNSGTSLVEFNDQDVIKALDKLGTFNGISVSYPMEFPQLPRMTQPGAKNPLWSIDNVKARSISGSLFEYTHKDVILYNLTVGAKWNDLPLVYENDVNFQVLPTFGTIPFFGAQLPFTYAEILPKWNPLNLLHGEIYLEVRKWPIPTSCKLVTIPRLLRVEDKGKAALVVTAYLTRDATTGEDIFYNESSAFIRDAGGFDSDQRADKRVSQPREKSANSGKPDLQAEDSTTPEQAALYRLNGDTNAAHIDPVVAKHSGFERPILHGLCSFGISGRQIYQKFGPIKSIRARFASIVIPGQTLRTEIWKRPGEHEVLFQTRVVETDALCMTEGHVVLRKRGDGSSL